MLLEGQCLQTNISASPKDTATAASAITNSSRTSLAGGLPALLPRKTGPQSPYRRTEQAVRQVLRYLFLDPTLPRQVIAQKLRQTHFQISLRSVHRIIADYGLQKKTLRPQPQKPAAHRRPPSAPPNASACEPADARSVERGVRQLLADKVSGNLLGFWLLVPEHLRLGTWDLLRTWSGELAQESPGPAPGPPPGP